MVAIYFNSHIDKEGIRIFPQHTIDSQADQVALPLFIYDLFHNYAHFQENLFMHVLLGCTPTQNCYFKSKINYQRITQKDEEVLEIIDPQNTYFTCIFKSNRKILISLLKLIS